MHDAAACFTGGVVVRLVEGDSVYDRWMESRAEGESSPSTTTGFGGPREACSLRERGAWGPGKRNDKVDRVRTGARRVASRPAVISIGCYLVTRAVVT